MLPSAYIDLDENEKAFIIAAIQIKTEVDKKKEKEMVRKSKKK